MVRRCARAGRRGGALVLPSRPFQGGRASAIYERQQKQNQPIFDEFVKLAQRLLPTPEEGSASVLDVASGPGEPALSMAAAMPHINVTVSDLEPDNLAIAKRRAEKLPNVVGFEVQDATALTAFPDASFDLVTMSYGLMFVEDREKCVHELHRVLKPGGELLLSYWKEMKVVTLARRVLDDTVRAVPVVVVTGGEPSDASGGPPPMPDPTALAQQGLAEKLLAKKFDVAETKTGSYSFYHASADEAFEAATLPARGALVAHAEATGDEAAVWAAARVSFDAACAEAGYGPRDDGSYVVGPNEWNLAIALKSPCDK